MLKPVSLDTEYESIIVPCKYDGCKDKFNLKEIRNHQNECVFKDLKTDNYMDLPVPRYDYEHDPLIKDRFLSYLIDSNKSLQEHFTTVGVTNEDQFKLFKDVLNNNFTEELLMQETIEMCKKCFEFNYHTTLRL